MSENSIEFSLSNSEQRDSWLNSSHWTLDADSYHLSSRGYTDFVISQQLLNYGTLQSSKFLLFCLGLKDNKVFI